VDVDVKIEPKLKIQNLVGTGELDFGLNLNMLAMNLDNVEYEPEQFPGLVYRIKSPFEASFLLFSNGKVVCAGTKGEKEMKKCFEKLINNLQKLKKCLRSKENKKVKRKRKKIKKKKR
jgi:transcription initiation factor TFIID TATA-box-binding protein